MKMECGLKTLLLSLSLILTTTVNAKTLKVDTLRPSVTNGNLTLEKDGSGELVLGDFNGVLKASTGVVGAGNVDLNSEVSGVLPVANGGTNSSTILNNDKVIISSGGSLVEDTNISTTELGYLDGSIENIQTSLNSKQPAITGVGGDLYYYNSGLSNLGIGTNGQLLRVSALGFPEWADAPISTTLTTKGQLQGFSTVNANVGPCTDDQILLFDTAEATGWKCSPLPSTSPTTTEGDIIVRGATEDVRLPIGTADQILISNGTTLVYGDLPISLPNQTGETGNYLYTNGTDASWENINNDTRNLKNNLLECGTFNNCNYEGVVTNGAGTDGTSVTTRTTEVPAFGASKLNLNQSVAGTLDYTVTKTANFENQQMITYCEIKTSNTGVTFNSMKDGVVQSRLNVSSDNKWKYYELPFVGGATSQGYKIDHVTSAEIPDIDVANCYLGKANPNIIREIGSAHFVGSQVTESASCVWSTNSAIYAPFPVDSDCTYINHGGLTEPLTKIPATVITNARTDGYYRVELSSMFRNSTTASNDCNYTLSSTSLNDGQQTMPVSGSENRRAYNLKGDFRFGTSGDKTIQVLGMSGDGSACEIYSDNSSRRSIFTASFYPDDTSTIVTQSTELTAKTANEFSASINDAGSAVDNLNYDGWVSCTDGGAGIQSCTYGSIGITQKMACVATVDRNGGSDFYATIDNSTVSGFTIKTYNQAGTLGSRSTSVHCSKQGADVNKSQTIVGKFENINSSELLNISATGNDGTGVVNTTNINFIETKDNKNAWNIDTFTVPVGYNGKYTISGLVALTTVAARVIDVYKGGVFYKRCGDVISHDSHSFSCDLDLVENDVITLRQNTTANLQNTESLHFLSIKQTAFAMDIVHNLSNQKTKCQTKILSAAVTANGVMSDLTFNNLTIGKLYRYNSKIQIYENPSPVSGFKEVYIDAKNGSTLIDRIIERTDANNIDYYRVTVKADKYFRATNTTLTTETASMNRTAIVGAVGLGTTYTYVELCELPDTYVETTEF